MDRIISAEKFTRALEGCIERYKRACACDFGKEEEAYVSGIRTAIQYMRFSDLDIDAEEVPAQIVFNLEDYLK